MRTWFKKYWLKVRLFFAKTHYAMDISHDDMTCIVGFKIVGKEIHIVADGFTDKWPQKGAV